MTWPPGTMPRPGTVYAKIWIYTETKVINWVLKTTTTTTTTTTWVKPLFETTIKSKKLMFSWSEHHVSKI